MKTTTAIIFAMTAGMTVNAAAIADQFNDRGPDFATGVSPSTYSGAAVTSNHGFTKRGENFAAMVTSTADAPRMPVKTMTYGFNDRGSDKIDTTPTTTLWSKMVAGTYYPSYEEGEL